MPVDAEDTREGERTPTRAREGGVSAFSSSGVDIRATNGARAALGLAAGRVVAVGVAVALAAWLVVLFGFDSSFPPTPLVATMALIPVNVATLLIARQMLHRDGSRLRDLIGFDRSRLGRDVLFALLWLAVLYLPFAASITGTMFALHGAEAIERFETVFVPDVVPEFPLAVAVVLGAMAVLTFAPINAPPSRHPTAVGSPCCCRHCCSDCSTSSSHRARRPWWSTASPSSCGGSARR
jgi:hypothetical protein